MLGPSGLIARKGLAVLAVSGLVLSACWGGEGEAEPSPSPSPEEPPQSPASAAQSVTSDDDLLTLDIPPGALTEDVEVTVEALGPDGLEALGPDEVPVPSDFAQLGLNVLAVEDLQAFVELLAVVHDLGPDGVEFAEPVTITRRVDRPPGFGLLEGLPLILLAIQEGPGDWAYLDDQSISLDGESVVISGTTTHLSPVVALSRGLSLGVRLTPDRDDDGLAEAPVGGTWSISGVVEGRGDEDPGEGVSISPFVSIGLPRGVRLADGADAGVDEPVTEEVVVGIPGEFEVLQLGFKCLQVGSSSWVAEVSLDFPEAFLPQVLEDALGLMPPGLVTTTVTGGADCVAPVPLEEVTLEDGCVAVSHDPLDGFPSHLAWDLSLSPYVAFAEGRRVSLTVRGANAGKPVTAPVEPGLTNLEMGFTSLGKKDIVRAILRGEDGGRIDLTKDFIEVFGRSITVTSQEGPVAGNLCEPDLPE